MVYNKLPYNNVYIYILLLSGSSRENRERVREMGRSKDIVSFSPIHCPTSSISHHQRRNNVRKKKSHRCFLTDQQRIYLVIIILSVNTVREKDA